VVTCVGKRLFELLRSFDLGSARAHNVKPAGISVRVYDVGSKLKIGVIDKATWAALESY
jgi:hypothetical protein